MVSSLSLGRKFTPSNSGFGGNFTKDWINLKTVPSWVETSIGGPVGFIVGGAAGILIGLGLEWLSDEIKEWIF